MSLNAYKSATGIDSVSYNNPEPVTAGADLRPGVSKSVSMTLTSAANVYTCTLPTTCRGVIIYPTVADVVFAVNENPAAAGAITGNVVAANFTVGHSVPWGIQTVRVLDDYVASQGASLRFISATANAVVNVSTF